VAFAVAHAGQARRPNPQQRRLSDVTNALHPCEGGACEVELRQFSVSGSQRNKPAQKAQLHDGVREPDGHEGLFATPGKNPRLGGHLPLNCCGLTVIPRPSSLW
jgi:hypothetical protein